MSAIDLSATNLGRRKVCEDCRTLLSHAVTKRARCPLTPKPSCRVCPVHCYAPKFRDRIREVMRFSGMGLVFRGRVHYLLHFLERKPKEVCTKDGEVIAVD